MLDWGFPWDLFYKVEVFFVSYQELIKGEMIKLKSNLAFYPKNWDKEWITERYITELSLNITHEHLVRWYCC